MSGLFVLRELLRNYISVVIKSSALFVNGAPHIKSNTVNTKEVWIKILSGIV